MASERWAAALTSLGNDLGQFATLKMKTEAMKLENQKAESLEQLRQQHQLASNAQNHGFRLNEIAQQGKLAMQQTDARNALQKDEWSRQDRRSIESNAQSQVSALNKQIMTLKDNLLQGKYLDPTAQSQVNNQIAQLQDQQKNVKLRSLLALAQQGDSRYKGLSRMQLALQAGYSKGEISALLRAGEPAPAPAAAVDGPGTSSAPPSPDRLQDHGKQGRKSKQPEQDLFAPTLGQSIVGGIADAGRALVQAGAPAIVSQAQTRVDKQNKFSLQRMKSVFSDGIKPHRIDVQRLGDMNDKALADNGFTPEQIQRIRFLYGKL